jgi:NADH-quinone oxidoreductase subunit G
MPTITINGKPCSFEAGRTILQVALDNDIEIPHYCYHPALSIVANCRICLGEVWAPNPRNENRLEPIPKLLPTCQTPAGDGQVVYTDSPKAIANQKAVMEYLLINHPVDCPVCDQAGECHLQDYSYQYGRGRSRFQEDKIKQPKKDVGPRVLLYSDRCIMCTRCVRFTREITGTGELIVDGRGAMEQIDVFPGIPLDNELSANVIDICPVGALLDKDFLFRQRVWFLEKTPSIDGITASGDNISIEHKDGRIYRIKPRPNLDVNRYWITDEVRYGWKFVHDDARLTLPRVRGEEPFDDAEAPVAYETAYDRIAEAAARAKRVALVASPMLSCEDAWLLASWVASLGAEASWIVGPVPFHGENKTFKGGFTMYAEKAPNARGVQRVLASFGKVVEWDRAPALLKSADMAVITGNYPSEWAPEELHDALGRAGAAMAPFVLLIDTLASTLCDRADVVLPAATWAEKAGTFENAKGRLQAFDRAIDPIDYAKSEAQIALDLTAMGTGTAPAVYNAALTRQRMAAERGLAAFVGDVHLPAARGRALPDVALVEL